jgi:peptidoglycan/LPS O-acetylase OafA/YrhL
MNFQTMSKQRKMILIAAAVGVIAMFLPWWSVSILGFSTGSVNGLHGWGIFVFLCFLGGGALAVMGNQTQNLSRTNWMLAVIAGGLASLIMAINFLSWLDGLSFLSFGFYLALAAAVAMLIFAYQNRSAGDTVQNGWDALKSGFGNTAGNTTTTNTPNTKIINPTNDPTKPVV